MRSYFIRVPRWARLIYPSATWTSKDEKSICWTIDDGPHPESTPGWLHLLDQFDLKAIFFLRGDQCEKYPDLLDAISKAGHQIGSHGYSHLDGWKTPSDKYLGDLKRSLEVIDSDLFRPPFGRMTPGQYKMISNQLKIVMWSVMPGDFRDDVSVNTLIQRSEMIRNGDIVVLHDHPLALKKASQLFQSYYNLQAQD